MATKIDEKRAKRILAEWQQSGKSANAFAKNAGVSASSLQRWRARFEDDSEQKFARVVVRRDSRAQARARDEDADQFVVETAGGFRIHVRSGFDPDEFGLLLEIVEGAGC